MLADPITTEALRPLDEKTRRSLRKITDKVLKLEESHTRELDNASNFL